MSSSLPDYYQTLQIRPTATSDVIEAVYRQLARTYHPDRNARIDTTSKMQAINVAYSILSNPQKRMEYDLAMAGNFGKVSPHISIKRWAMGQWSTMSWDAKLSALCVILSVVCLLGIATNLAERQLKATTHAAVNATVVSMQAELSIAETVTAITMESVHGPQPMAELNGNGNQPTTGTEANVGTENARTNKAKKTSAEPISTAIPDAVIALPIAPASAPVDHFDFPAHTTAKAGFAKTPPEFHVESGALDTQQRPLTVVPPTEATPINMIQRALDTLVGELFEAGRSPWGIIQMESHPHYRQLNLLPNSRPLHDSDNTRGQTN